MLFPFSQSSNKMHGNVLSHPTHTPQPVVYFLNFLSHLSLVTPNITPFVFTSGFEIRMKCWECGLQSQTCVSAPPLTSMTMRSGSVRKPIIAFGVLRLSHSLSSWQCPNPQSFPHPHIASYHLYNCLPSISKSVHSLKVKFIFKGSLLLFQLNIVWPSEAGSARLKGLVNAEALLESCGTKQKLLLDPITWIGSRVVLKALTCCSLWFCCNAFIQHQQK